MRTVIKMKFGSHLYGTSTPLSDTDYKVVAIPSARDILLGRGNHGVTIPHKIKALGEKNLPGDVDEERFSLQKYLNLLCEGQTVALDMLFATPNMFEVTPSREWFEIQDNRHKLISRKSAAFVGYCRQQANKYGIKGSRVAAARKALALLREAKPIDKLETINTQIRAMVASTDQMAVIDLEQPNKVMIPHWKVCGRKMAYRSTIKEATNVMQHLVDEYGSRALMAETQNGVDWKALSHAVRVGQEALELFRKGTITFPLINAEYILAIKQGRVLYQEVAQAIETLLERIEMESPRSALPEKPDLAWVDGFIARTYGAEVIAEMS